jgi:hypothetical protein
MHVPCFARKLTSVCPAGVLSLWTAFELSLDQGVHFERRLFHLSFATVCLSFPSFAWQPTCYIYLVRLDNLVFRVGSEQADQKEGMAAFAEKRKPAWRHA